MPDMTGGGANSGDSTTAPEATEATAAADMTAEDTPAGEEQA